MEVELLPAAVRSSHNGMKVLSISEVEEGMLENALKLTSSSMVMFHDIPGFRYSTQVYLKAEEAFALIGMSLPV